MVLVWAFSNLKTFYFFWLDVNKNSSKNWIGGIKYFWAFVDHFPATKMLIQSILLVHFW